MRKTLLAVVLLVNVLIIFPAWAEVVSSRTILDNGLTVIVSEMPSTPVAAVYAWVKTGSANEGKYLGSGITHFVEHMLFKGTARRPAGTIPDEVKSLGGSINASTGHDFTVYTLTLPRENVAKGIDLIADMVRNASFDPVEVERERDVILKELRMINDKPDRKLDELVYANVYRVHPYRFPIIGREAMFKTITRDDLIDYYRTYYAPNNTIVSVAGQFKADEILPLVKEKFADAVPRPTPLRDLPAEPDQISARSVEESYATDLYRMTETFQGVPLLHRDLYALDVLAMALGNGESSRLERVLYKGKKLVERVEATNYTPLDRGYVEISVMMRQDRRAEVLAEIRRVIAELRQRGLSEEELKRIKRQVAVENVRSRETAGGMAYRTAIEEAFAGDYQFSDKYVQGVASVTNEDIKRVAGQYLVDERSTVVVLAPRGSANPVAAKAATASSEIEKIVLANGLTLLLKEDHALPTVTVDLLLRGGTLQEPEEKLGLAALTGSVWSKGFKGKDWTAISREVENRGGSLLSFSSRESLGIQLSFLSEDIDFALNYLENFVKAPTFPEDAFELDRQQMLTALVARRDSVMQTGSKELIETLFLTHPFRRDGVGTEETIKRIQRTDLPAYLRQYLSSDNIVIAVYGDIDKRAIKSSLERRFGSLAKTQLNFKRMEEPAPEAQRFKEITMDKEQSAVLYGFRAPVIDDSQTPSLQVALNILTSPLGGRMFKRIREELGKAYALGGGYSPGLDVGMAMFYVLTTDENVPRVRAVVEEELARIVKEPVSEKELADAKIYLKSQQARDLETLTALAYKTSNDELLKLGFDRYTSLAKRIDAVSADSLRATAREYLQTSRAAVVVVHGRQPSPAVPGARAGKAAAKTGE